MANITCHCSEVPVGKPFLFIRDIPQICDEISVKDFLMLLNIHKYFYMVSVDRSICPDYNYCYYIFKEFRKLCDLSDLTGDVQKFLMDRLKRYNDIEGEECAKMDVTESDYVIMYVHWNIYIKIL